MIDHINKKREALGLAEMLYEPGQVEAEPVSAG